MGFPRQNTEVGCHALFKGSSWSKDWTRISASLHWQAGSLPLAPPGKPSVFLLILIQLTLEWPGVNPCIIYSQPPCSWYHCIHSSTNHGLVVLQCLLLTDIHYKWTLTVQTCIVHESTVSWIEVAFFCNSYGFIMVNYTFNWHFEIIG